MGIAAFGAQLQIGDGASPESFTTVAEITDLTVTVNGEEVDTTNHESAGSWMERDGTIKSMEISGEGNLLIADNTQDANDGLLNDLDNQTIRNFQIVFPDSSSTTWDVSALPSTWEASMTYDDKASLSFTLSVSGQPTLR